MLFKKNRKPFKLRIDKRQAEREREIFEGEPPEVKAMLKLCKIFMAAFMPFGAGLAFLPNILASLLLLFGAAFVSFVSVKLRMGAGWKMSFVPPVCVFAGFLMGQFLLKKSILMELLKI